LESNVIELEKVRKVFKLRRNIQSSNTELSNQFISNHLVALDDISFKVSQGEVLGILGMNGSGKTTLLRLISGILKPTAGRITVSGKLAPLLHLGTGFQEELVASENIIMYGMLLGLSKADIQAKVKNIIKFSGLENFTTMKLKHYSTGMRIKLAFTTAMQVDPDIILIDEILAVGDLAFREKSYKELLSFQERKKTMVFTSHNLQTILDLSDRALLLDKGKIELISEPSKVVEKYKDLIKKLSIT